MAGIRLLPIFLLVSIVLQGQQLSLYTQYRENMTLINPAGMESDFLAFGQNLTFGASYRAQWVGLTNGPTTQTIRASYVNKESNGVSILAGGFLLNDQTGPTGFTGLYGRIGGVISPDPQYSGLAVAISAGAVQYRVNASEIRLRDQGDVVGTQDQSQLFPDVGVGLFYYQALGDSWRDADMIYAGVSVPQVIGLDLTFENENGEFFTKRVQHFYGQFGYIKFFDNDSFLEPSAWVKYVQGAPINVDFNLRYQLPSSIWVGTGISTASNLHLETGFMLGRNVGFDSNIRFGYGFDYSFSSFGPTAGTTHEINITFAVDR